MAVTLGTLLLEVGLDLERYQADMEAAKVRAAEFGAEMSRIYNNADVKPPSGFKDTQEQFGRSPLRPVVDMTELHALNAEFDVKKMHHVSLQGHFERNHLTPRVDDSQLVELNNTLDLTKERLEREYKLNVTTDGIADVERQLKQQQVTVEKMGARGSWNTGFAIGQKPFSNSYRYDRSQGKFRYADGPMEGRYAKTEVALMGKTLGITNAELKKISDKLRGEASKTTKASSGMMGFSRRKKTSIFEQEDPLQELLTRATAKASEQQGRELSKAILRLFTSATEQAAEGGSDIGGKKRDGRKSWWRGDIDRGSPADYVGSAVSRTALGVSNSQAKAIGNAITDLLLRAIEEADPPEITQEPKIQTNKELSVGAISDIQANKDLSVGAMSDEMSEAMQSSVETGVRDGIKPGLFGRIGRMAAFTIGSVAEGALTASGEQLFKAFGRRPLYEGLERASKYADEKFGIKLNLDPGSLELDKISDGIAEKTAVGVSEGMQDADKASKPNIFKRLLSNVSNQFNDIFRGLNESTGAAIGERVGKGLADELENSLAISFADLGKKRARFYVGTANVVAKMGTNVLGIDVKESELEIAALYRAVQSGLSKIMPDLEAVERWADETSQIIGDRISAASFKVGDGIIATFEEEGFPAKIQAFFKEAFSFDDAKKAISEMITDLSKVKLDLYPSDGSESRSAGGWAVFDKVVQARRKAGRVKRAIPRVQERVEEIMGSDIRGPRNRKNSAKHVVDDKTEEIFIVTGGMG